MEGSRKTFDILMYVSGRDIESQGHRELMTADMVGGGLVPRTIDIDHFSLFCFPSSQRLDNPAEMTSGTEGSSPIRNQFVEEVKGGSMT